MRDDAQIVKTRRIYEGWVGGTRHKARLIMNSMESQPYDLLKEYEEDCKEDCKGDCKGDCKKIPWLELFESFLQRRKASSHWVCTQDGKNGPWTAYLTVNENPVPNAIGVASTKKGAQNALVEQLHVQQHPVLVRVF
ncbi:hypothetical protein CTheo_459 [Ceratobasidium theobromae]|uniref:Uncharacterized protein n=1 Tax=Ceratobasidium theobromae TaxID=1582974 RepID=A0A5N5QZ50_9AGAM|nr:hypothetical protein CTheo_459 [Ceratobasidium theobromae]